MTRTTHQRLDPETGSRLLDGAVDDDALVHWQDRFRQDPVLAGEMAAALAQEARLRAALQEPSPAATIRPSGSGRHPVQRASRNSRRAAWIAVAAGLLGVVVGVGGGRLLPLADRPDPADRLAAWQAGLQTALENQPSGAVVTLADPAGPVGTLTLEIERTYRAADGRYCRAYRQSVTSPAGTLAASGVACRATDGTWRLFETGDGGSA